MFNTTLQAMYPRSATSSYTTCGSFRRRVLYQSRTQIPAKEMMLLDPMVILRIVQKVREELAYTQLENTWMISYLQHHNKPLLDGILNEKATIKTHVRRIQFADHQQFHRFRFSSYSSSAGDDMESMLLRDAMLNTGRMSGTSLNAIASGSMTCQSDAENLVLCVSFKYKTELCEKETHNIQTKIQELRKSTFERTRKILAATENSRLTNEEVKKSHMDIIKFMGPLKAGDILAHREQCNRLRKYINNWLSNGERQAQRFALKNLSMDKLLGERLRSIEFKQIRRGKFLPIDFAELEIEVAGKKIQLKTLERAVRGIHAESAKRALERKWFQEKVAKLTKTSENITKQTEKINTELERYDNEREEIERKKESWEKRVAKAEAKRKQFILPSIDEYMMSKRQLTDLDKELAALRRSQSVAHIELKVAQAKLKSKKSKAEQRIQKKDSARKNWLSAVSAVKQAK